MDLPSQQLNGKNESSVEVSLRGTSRSNINGALFIGRRGNGDYGFKGHISEVLLINDKLTSNQRQAITHYLAQKHNLTSSVDSDADGTRCSRFFSYRS